MRPHTLHKPRSSLPIIVENRRQRLFALNLDFPICPTRDLDNGIDDGGVVLVGVERDVVPERDGVAFVQQPDSPVEGVAGEGHVDDVGAVVDSPAHGLGDLRVGVLSPFAEADRDREHRRLGRRADDARTAARAAPGGASTTTIEASITSIMELVNLDRSDPTALHEQVAAQIRRSIADGEAKPGERLPPAKDLAAVMGVNTNTVLRALRSLRDEGLLK